jgi:hypothetical protein
VTSDHSANYYMPGVDGKLPRDKDQMLEAVDTTLERVRARARAR